MRITVRGWARDMGKKVIADYDLDKLSISRDPNRTVYRDEEARIFPGFGKICIAWFQELRNMGDYRMEVELTDEDVLKLFKWKFGKELDVSLIDEAGFSVSSDLAKRVLRTIKLSDVTLADLAAMNVNEGSATAENLLISEKVKPFKR